MISLIKPIGHCFGVIKAIELAKEVKDKYPDRDVYVFGLLVHNEEVVSALSSYGIKTITVNPTRAIDQLKAFKKRRHRNIYGTWSSSIL